MAHFAIVDPTGQTRTRYVTVDCSLVSESYGPKRKYNNINTGGSWMRAILGPDLGDGQRRGSATSQYSLQPVMGNLHSESMLSWVAGHLLNADFGGSGSDPANLTALTSQANSNHATFEQHIKDILTVCHRIDSNNRDHGFWYGVDYQVVVDATPFAASPAIDDWHSYAYSHITLTYSIIRIDKAARSYAVVPGTDQYYTTLTGIPAPTFTIGTQIQGALNGPITFGPLEIHNV